LLPTHIMKQKQNSSWIEKGFQYFFGETFSHRFEKITLYLALAGFAIHLILIGFNQLGWITLSSFNNPISAIYTPFSFILIYEVYLLIYYLPRSFSTSIGKQYEIISLIVIRRIFKDITKIELDGNWFQNTYDIRIMVDLVGFLVLFLLIYWFTRLKNNRPKIPDPKKVQAFITFKKATSLILLPILIGLASYSLVDWILELQQFRLGRISELSNINNIFYDEFFNLLIVVDVTMLIVSLLYTDRYSQLVRNTGFVISTILIRISFTSEGITNILLIIGAVFFGTLILAIYNMVERNRA